MRKHFFTRACVFFACQKSLTSTRGERVKYTLGTGFLTPSTNKKLTRINGLMLYSNIRKKTQRIESRVCIPDLFSCIQVATRGGRSWGFSIHKFSGNFLHYKHRKFSFACLQTERIKFKDHETVQKLSLK